MSLPSSMADCVPCDRQLQKAYKNTVGAERYVQCFEATRTIKTCLK